LTYAGSSRAAAFAFVQRAQRPPDIGVNRNHPNALLPNPPSAPRYTPHLKGQLLCCFLYHLTITASLFLLQPEVVTVISIIHPMSGGLCALCDVLLEPAFAVSEIFNDYSKQTKQNHLIISFLGYSLSLCITKF